MREYHEVRRDVSGDPEAAAPYIGLARTLLGQLKTRMHMGGLQQLSRTVTLPDGTTISVLSRMGQDTIRIFAATPGSVPSGPEGSSVPQSVPADILTPQVDVPSSSLSVTLPGSMTMAGECDDTSGFNFNGHLALWRSRRQVLDPGYPPDANAANDGESTTTTGGCSGISDDGSVLVGTGLLPRTEGSTGFRYSKSGGFQLLGGFGPIMDTFVSGVSGDGGTISAMSQDWDSSHGYLPCVWTKSAGLQFLPNNGALFGNAWGVSKSGEFLCGQLYLSYNGFNYTIGAARWRNGVLTILVTGKWNDVGYGVANNGMVVGARSGSASNSFGACYWTPQGQMVSLLPPGTGAQSSQALDVTPDGSLIVGVTGGANNPASGAKGGYPQVGAQAWYWTAAKGITYLGAGVANVVSPDGSVIAGSTGVASPQPVFWSPNGKVTPLPLVSATSQGCVSAIGLPPPKTYTAGN